MVIPSLAGGALAATDPPERNDHHQLDAAQ